MKGAPMLYYELTQVLNRGFRPPINLLKCVYMSVISRHRLPKSSGAHIYGNAPEYSTLVWQLITRVIHLNVLDLQFGAFPTHILTISSKTRSSIRFFVFIGEVMPFLQ